MATEENAKEQLEIAVESIDAALETGDLAEYVDELQGMVHRINDIRRML